MFSPKDFDFMSGSQLDSFIKLHDKFDSKTEEIWADDTLDYFQQSKLYEEEVEKVKNYWNNAFWENFENKKLKQ